MGNVNMEASQINDRTEDGKHQSVAEHLKALDALAQQIEDMPAYTSSDREWLDEWESKLPELPEDPETDGVKVLTATTTSGETVKTWEEPESGGVPDYSTTEQATGQKWIDGKDIYFKTVVPAEELTLTSQTWTSTGESGSGISTIVNAFGVDSNGSYFTFNATPDVSSTGYIGFLQTRSQSITITKFVIFYTKAA